MYGAIHQELAAGRADSPIVEQAKQLIYSLDKKDAYISSEARGMFSRDQVEDQYIKRLGALLDVLEEKTGRNMYK